MKNVKIYKNNLLNKKYCLKNYESIYYYLIIPYVVGSFIYLNTNNFDASITIGSYISCYYILKRVRKNYL